MRLLEFPMFDPHETPVQSHVIKMSIELAKKQFSTSIYLP